MSIKLNLMLPIVTTGGGDESSEATDRHEETDALAWERSLYIVIPNLGWGWKAERQDFSQERSGELLFQHEVHNGGW